MLVINTMMFPLMCIPYKNFRTNIKFAKMCTSLWQINPTLKERKEEMKRKKESKLKNMEISRQES